METEVGDCYEASANALLMPSFAGGHDLPDGATLVHGRPTLTCPPFVEYGHAWLEFGDVVFDVANGRDVIARRELYYKAGNIDPAKCHRYTKDEARKRVLDFRHYGPWEGGLG